MPIDLLDSRQIQLIDHVADEVDEVAFRQPIAQTRDWRRSIHYTYYEDSWQLHGKGQEAMAEPYCYFTPHRIGPHRGVRSGRYKLIEYYGEGDYWELFDLEKDPDGLNNLHADASSQAIAADLSGELQRLRALYRDTQ